MLVLCFGGGSTKAVHLQRVFVVSGGSVKNMWYYSCLCCCWSISQLWRRAKLLHRKSWREAESLKTVKSLHCSHFLYFLCSIFNIWWLFRPSASSDLQLQFAQEHVCGFWNHDTFAEPHFLCNLQEYVSLSSTLTLLTLTLLVMVDCSVSMLNANIEKTIKQHLDLFSLNIMSL